jgi:hypothetical protein
MHFIVQKVLKPYIHKQKQGTKNAILIKIRISCALYELAHGSIIFLCANDYFFAIGRSTMSLVV